MRRTLIVFAGILLVVSLTGCGSLHQAKPRADVVANIPKESAIQILRGVRGNGTPVKWSCMLSEAGVRRNNSRMVVAYPRLYLHFYENSDEVLIPFVANRESRPFYLPPSDFIAGIQAEGKYNGCTLGAFRRGGAELPQAYMDKIATAWRALGGKMGD